MQAHKILISIKCMVLFLLMLYIYYTFMNIEPQKDWNTTEGQQQ